MAHSKICIRLGSGSDLGTRETFRDGRLEVRSSRGVRGVERTFLRDLDVDLDGRILVVGGREALVAVVLARLEPSAEVHWWTFDAFELQRAWAVHGSPLPPNLSLTLKPDLPGDGSYDWVVAPMPRAQDATLAADLLRGAVRSLKSRGKVLAFTDDPRGQWAYKRIVEVFGAATIQKKTKRGVLLIARRRPGHQLGAREFRRSFSARILGRTIDLETRPGVFSHGRLDGGTLALSEVMAVEADSRIVDLGCGSGALGIAGALAAPDGCALLVDSNARATDMARQSAQRNGASRRALVLLASDARAIREASFDLAVANPSQLSDYRMAPQLIEDGFRLLIPGGCFYLAGKAPEYPEELIQARFGSCESFSRRGYTVLAARKPGGPATDTG